MYCDTSLAIIAPVPHFTFAVAPPRVVVEDGIEVVDGYDEYDEEIFYVDGYYWVFWDSRWWRRVHHHHGKWIVVAHAHVPGRLHKAHDKHRRRGHKIRGKHQSRKRRH